MWYFWWGCRGILTLITLRSERVKVFVEAKLTCSNHPDIFIIVSSCEMCEKCTSEVVRIGSIIIFHLSKLWKARFFILCVMWYFWWSCSRNLNLITLGSGRVKPIWHDSTDFHDRCQCGLGPKHSCAMPMGPCKADTTVHGGCVELSYHNCL